MGVDPDVMTAEVAEYNTLCHAGVDTRFYKPKFLLPVERAPFFAIRMEPAVIITMGGIAINDNMQVVDEDGRPIPGLYSVGCDAGGLFGESYALTGARCRLRLRADLGLAGRGPHRGRAQGAGGAVSRTAACVRCAGR